MRVKPGPAGDERQRGSLKAAGRKERGFEDSSKPRNKVMKAALSILAARSCSEGQLRDRLNAKGWADAGLIEDCIKRLKELGYVNDALFAHSYANYRVSSKPLGRARLARELALRKVPKAKAEEALDSVFGEAAEETLIDRAIARRLRTHGRPADRAAAKRMFDHLARLGFEYDLIVNRINGLRKTRDE